MATTETEILPGPVKFDPAGWYTEYLLRLMGISETVLRNATRRGKLRFKEVSRGCRIYLGAWLQEWLEGAPQS